MLTAAALISAGCGGSTGGESAADSPGPPAPLVLEVSIKGGNVNPTNEQLHATINQPIVIRVGSDAADQLHVHSTPEHTFNIEAKPAQSFQFTIDVPGRVDVELHALERTIATISVQ